MRDKKEKYEQKRDASLLSADVHDLFEFANPDRVVELFSVKLRDPNTQIVRHLRYLIRFTSDTSAVLIVAGTVIGDLMTEDAIDLAAKIRAAGKASGMLTVLAETEPDFAGIFQVKLLNRKDIRRK